MKTVIGFLTVGSLIRKGGNLLQVIAIDAQETVAVDRSGIYVEFDTPVLDLQDVSAS